MLSDAYQSFRREKRSFGRLQLRRRVEKEQSLIQRFLKLAIVPAVMALVALAVVTAPASAHSTITSQGNDYAVTDSSHRTGAVCDMERDGHFVSARWTDSEGFTVAYEEDGGDSGCDQVTFDGVAESVVVCELDVGAFWCSEVDYV